MNDWQLVQQYVNRGSEAAFSALVARHLGLVYSTAIRQVHNAQLAEEVAQAVFILMARKAASFRQDVVLPGWLYRTARFVGATAARAEQRQRQREQEALLMQQDSRADEAWRRLLPALDEALEQLRASDVPIRIVLERFADLFVREIYGTRRRDVARLVITEGARFPSIAEFYQRAFGSDLPESAARVKVA